MRKNIDFDRTTGLGQDFEYVESENKTVIRTYQDVEQILERNKQLQNADEYKRNGIKNEFQHAASIPLAVVHEWLKEGIDVLNPEHWPRVKAKLMDPENRYLRTTLGQI